MKFGKITFKENFILSPVTAPLICLRHSLRVGWGISNADGQQWLVKGDLGMPEELRGNFLVGKGRICVVQAGMKKEECVEEVEKKECGRVNALVLLPALQNLLPGWNRINEDLWAIRSTTMEHQDTTVVPAGTMLLYGRRCLEATEVLTLAYNFRPRRGGQLGFYENGADEMLEDFVAGVPVRFLRTSWIVPRSGGG